MIRLEGVHKVYDDGFQALKDINLQFHEGDTNVLIGPSGCGKTTTMKLLNRLINPSRGKIYINDEDISKTNPVDLRRTIGYVIQHIGLFPHMSIASNVAIVPRLLKWEKKRIQERVDELLDLVGLDPKTYRNRYPSELSGGQQQRIGVIRALAAEPSIILMDEPFSALDPISREQLQDELVRLQENIQKTIVFVTHDMDEALKIADRIVLMREGEVVQNDTPENILRHPADEFVKDFIGKKRLEDSGEETLPNAEEVMVKNPVVAYPSRGLAESLNMMERGKVDSLIVVDRDKTLKGYVSVWSVLNAYRDESLTLKDIMEPFETVVEPGTSVEIALELMNEHKLSYVPVIKEGNQFIGVITRGSIVKLMADVYASDGREAL